MPNDGKKKQAIILLTLAFFFISIVSRKSTFEVSAQDFGFDIMERFDEIQDWKGIPLNGEDYNVSRMPKKLDGSDSMWDMYHYWSPNSSPETFWIGNHGSANVWGGIGKSLKMDLSQGLGSKRGPSRLGSYFGSGTSNSGYSEIYVFSMYKFPSNAFPIHGTGIGYKYFAYYKFGTLSTGFSDSRNNPLPGIPGVYGKNYLLIQIGTGASQNDQLKIRMDWRNPVGEDRWTSGVIDTFIANEEWFGLEYYIKIGTPGQANGHATVWLYDSHGNSTQIYDEDRMILPIAVGGVDSSSHKFNKWFFGGNLDFASGGEVLDHAYYVDDFIVHSNRIGPQYFGIIHGVIDSVSPANPTGLR